MNPNERDSFRNRPTKKHELKTWPGFFWQLAEDKKLFEIRRNDRDFMVGDTLYLREWDPHTKEYSGRAMMFKVIHMLKGGLLPGGKESGIQNDYVVMSIERILEGE